MAGPWKLWRWPVLILLTVVCTGCNLMSLPYFLCAGDDKMPAQMQKLADADKGKEVKVAIVAYSGLVTQPEFVTADRDLPGMLARSLQETFKENKENVVLVPNGQVIKYKDNHPDWHLDLVETGKHFKVDYLVYLDIQSLSLYEKGCFNQLYRGRGDIHVTVIDMHKPEDYHATKDYHCEYPRSGPVPADDRNSQEFQRAFLGDIAKRLSWYFADHPPSNDIASD